MPLRAPRAIAASTALGIESTSAQGEPATSSAMAL